MNLKATYYFQIAGFNFKVHFHHTPFFYLRDKFRKSFLYYIEKFLLPRKPKKIHIRIYFKNTKPYLFNFRKNLTHYYSELYREERENEIETNYAISIIQFQSILRLLLQKLLLSHGDFSIHASASKINGKAYLFIGPSGAGKTTIINMLKEEYPLLMDDIGIIRQFEDGYWFYQTPYVEKELKIINIPKPERLPLGKAFFIHKANCVKSKKITNKEYLVHKLFAQIQANQENLPFFSQKITAFISKFDNFNNLYFNKAKKDLLVFFKKEENN